ncbi:Holin family protein [compost metagenome]
MFLITALIIASKYETAFVPVVKGVYIYFMLTEFKSIIENVEEMGVKVPQVIKTLISLRLKFHGGEDKVEEGKKPTRNRKGDS